MTPTPPASVLPVPHRAAAPVTPDHLGNRGTPDPGERARLRASVGAVLRRERLAHRLSQHALAALAGCHPRTVERVEAGRIRPTTGLLEALAVALVVPPGWSMSRPRRESVEAMRAELAAAAGPSLVESTPGGERRRRRRLRRARLAAASVAIPVLRARHGLRPQRQAARVVPAEVAAAVWRYR